MATTKLFNVVGVSKLNGEHKVRFATDIMRIKVLAKHGHEDIRLCELDAAVSKYDAAKQIALMEDFADAAAQNAIAEYLEDKAPKAAPKPQVKAAVKAKATPQVKAIKGVTPLGMSEDAPF